MKKSEMEEHRAAYHLFVSGARTAVQQGDFVAAINLASKSWDYIDGMMQFERKYEAKEFRSVDGIDIVLEYAPLIFDFESLDRLGVLLKSQRRIDKNASDDLANKLDQAKELLDAARHLWNRLEAFGGREQHNISPQIRSELKLYESILSPWEQMGIATSASHNSLAVPMLNTRMDDQVPVKCPSCGARGQACKSRILGEVTCPKCFKSVVFVILAIAN